MEIHKDSGRRLGVIGTAGRDKTAPMSRGLWDAMCVDLHARIQPHDVLVSGGAAWADHLAVHAFLKGWCTALQLYLPAPFQNGRYVGPYSSSGSAANYYHERFCSITGVDSLGQIALAIERGAEVAFEPAMAGYRGMFARNLKVAGKSTALLAYTFGVGATIAGGTNDTWVKCKASHKVHVCLTDLLQVQPA